METLYLLDTNIILHYARRSVVQQKIEPEYRLLSRSEIALVSYVSEAEARTMAAYREWGKPALTQLEFVLGAFRTVPIEQEEILKAYTEVDVYSRTQGIKMGKNDLWIAATVRVTGATLLTTDMDFDHLEGIMLAREWIDPIVERQS
nr:type II toxin-antitoxin system VapC family toxin [Armatimonas sp.]